MAALRTTRAYVVEEPMAKGPSARRLAARVLQDVERGAGFSNRALSRQLERHPGMDVRDRGLVTTLVYGVLRHRGRLDAHIDTHAKRPKHYNVLLKDELLSG